MAKDETSTTEDLEKTQELDTNDLTKKQDKTEEVTEDIDVNPVRKRFDSSQWITSW